MRLDSLADAVLKDAQHAPIAEAERALVAYAVALTRDPADPSAPRVAALRAVGFQDEAILAATEITAYFNYVNRLAHGLGVEIED